MPAPASLPAHRGGSVLLVEEYDALAAAIGSALRKFAPGRALAIGESLDAAERLLGERGFDLLVIDFDPPLPDAVAFLQRIKLIQPEARVLVIIPGAAGLSRERLQPFALHFVEKPFEVAEFGGLVEALLGMGGSPGDELCGTLRDLGLADMIALHALSEATAVLTVELESEPAGEVHFLHGQIVHAVVGDQDGIAAVKEMIGWPSPEFRSSAKGPDGPRTVRVPWRKVLERSPSAGSGARRMARPRAAPKVLRPPPTGKKVLVVDDTETLRVFVEEMLATADPTLQIAMAANGTDGLRQAVETLPDLVLLDFSLPDLNGDEVCRHLLADAKTAQVPVIMMSGHVQEMNAAATEFENIVGTLAKPFISASLVELVKITLRNPRTIAARPKETPVSAPKPVIAGATASVPVALPTVSKAPPSFPEPPTTAPLLTPARFTQLSSNAVVVGLSLEVTSLQFSSALQVSSICARPVSRIVSVHAEPAGGLAFGFPEAGFELDRVELDPLGKIETLRIAPAERPAAEPSTGAAVPIGDLHVIPSKRGTTLHLIPALLKPMKIQLLASFELAAVELTAGFGVAHLVLRARGGRMRATLQPEEAQSGALVEIGQVLLDDSTRIVELTMTPGTQG